MTYYFAKYYDEMPILIKAITPDILMNPKTETFIYRDGTWKTSPDHLFRITCTPDYDEITEEEAMELIKCM